MSEPTAPSNEDKAIQSTQQAVGPTPETPDSDSGQPDGDSTDFFTNLEAFLEKLVPPDEVTVDCCDGSRITIPGSIPARRQVKVFRLMKEFMDLPAVEAAVNGLSDAKGGAAGLVGLVVGLATDEELAEMLGKIFSEAYPDALDGKDPLDLLAMEELVVGLLPFSERFLKRLGTGMMTVGKSAGITV